MWLSGFPLGSQGALHPGGGCVFQDHHQLPTACPNPSPHRGIQSTIHPSRGLAPKPISENGPRLQVPLADFSSRCHTAQWQHSGLCTHPQPACTTHVHDRGLGSPMETSWIAAHIPCFAGSPGSRDRGPLTSVKLRKYCCTKRNPTWQKGLADWVSITEQYLLQQHSWAAQGRASNLQAVHQPLTPSKAGPMWKKGKPAYWEQLQARLNIIQHQPTYRRPRGSP